MSLLSDLIPTNLATEKAKFLADTKYNPQFTYELETAPQKLTQYGYPSKPLLDLAHQILEETYYGRNYLDLKMMEGRVVSEAEVTEKIMTFLKMHHLQDRFSIVWSSSFISRASMDSSAIKLRKNTEFREESLLSVIYHEIGTHGIRRINYEQQPWYKNKKKFGLTHLYLPTEEGVATLHSLLPRQFTSAYQTAIRYVAIEYARNHSFSELWHFLSQYTTDLDYQWMICFRQKRGLTDTSQGGGSTKDLVYFEGAIKVWQWLKQHSYTLDEVYWGKMAVEDIPVAVQLNPDFKPLLPSFYTVDPQKYAKKIDRIGLENHFDEVPSLLS